MIDMKKEYKTRGGNNVRVLCTDRKGPRPVVVLVEGIVSEKSDILSCLRSNGQMFDHGMFSDGDLVETGNLAKPTKTANIIALAAGTFIALGSLLMYLALDGLRIGF